MDGQSGWTIEAVRELREMAKERIPVSTMSLKLKRPVDAIRAKLAELGMTAGVD